MKFTVLSHAGLLVESGDCSVLIDPWLVGSCYWRSWFNFPEPDRTLIDSLTPDWIYLTHLHWDHFHGPSLRRFHHETPMLVPRMMTTRMVRDLRRMGFSNIQEIPHGGRMQLAAGFALHSFHFVTDSLIVLQDASATLLDANDCKCLGLTLRQITRRFPRIDFVLRSHSSASPIPYCIEGYEGDFSGVRTKENYMGEFASFARAVGARYAIPFASNHCFVHPQTRHFNATAVLPNAVAAHTNAMRAHQDHPECVVMPSGSSWDHMAGFEIRDFDYETQVDYVETLSARYADKLHAQLAREASARGDFNSFKKYFRAFLNALCWPLRRMLPATVFGVEEAGGRRFWRVDFRMRQVDEVAVPGSDCLLIAMPALVINDCCRKKMFSAWTPSKRLRIRLGGASLNQLILLLTLFDFHEHDQLPLRRFFGLRSLSIWRRRWREPLDLLWSFIKVKVFHRPIASLYEV